MRRALGGAARTRVGRRTLQRAASELQRALAPDEPQPPPPSGAPNRARWHTTTPATPYASPRRLTLPHLNKLCALEDWANPALVAAMRRQLPYYVEDRPAFPAGFEHRKHWEFAQVVVGLEQLGVAGRKATVLAVGAGHEEPIFDLTTRARWVFATDIYGSGAFQLREADTLMLVDPEAFAVCPYNRRHLVVQYMSALDLRYDDGTFDSAYSLSSIEHFGGPEAAAAALAEMARVLKPGGMVAITTECIVNGASHSSDPGLELFTPDELTQLFTSVRGLEPVDQIDLVLSPKTKDAPVRRLRRVLDDAARGHIDYPSLLLEHRGRVFTSASIFLRRA